MKISYTVNSWYQDLCSCLQVDAACVLSYFGHDPLLVLGAGWGFCFCPDDWEPVEFFYPTPNDDLGHALAPHHPLHCQWHFPSRPEEAEIELIKILEKGVLPIVAVDNYHLPFRPAYHDVHAAHLVIIHGYDSEQNMFDVLDPMPPAYQGKLPASILEGSRLSANPNDGSDPFFAGRNMGMRWLKLHPTGEFPPLTRGWVKHVLTENRAGFFSNTSPASGFLSGKSGLQTYLTTLPERAMQKGEIVLREIYVLGWAVQASTSLHADFLSYVGRQLHVPALCEAGCWVDLVAHEWTPLRIAAAHALTNPQSVIKELAILGHRVLNRWLEAQHHITLAEERSLTI